MTPTKDPRIHLMLATEWLPASGYRPRAVVTREPTALDLETYQGSLIAGVLQGLAEAELEEAEIYPVDGRPMSYLRIWHRTDGSDLMTEARTWIHEDVAWTVVSTVEHTDYPDFCDLFEDLTLHFEEPT
ncbi:hypothetical protein NODU109028_11350 [Nocardioides dubius]|uniref:Uncharacterized protein n=2 Tax=Nocardioides dubius TaxID=317019 RepID=A0ABN1TRM2_9ACTN